VCVYERRGSKQAIFSLAMRFVGLNFWTRKVVEIGDNKIYSNTTGSRRKFHKCEILFTF
jgi:hypothetical protein